MYLPMHSPYICSRWQVQIDGLLQKLRKRILQKWCYSVKSELFAKRYHISDLVKCEIVCLGEKGGILFHEELVPLLACFGVPSTV